MRLSSLELIAVLFAPLLLKSTGACDVEGAELDAPVKGASIEEGQVQSNRLLTGFRLSIDNAGSNCMQLRFQVSGSRTSRKHILERRRWPGDWVRVAEQPANSASVIFYDKIFLPDPSERYEYRARYEVRYFYWYILSHPTPTITYHPEACDVPKDFQISVYLASPNDVPLPYSHPWVGDLMFGDDPDEPTLRNYLLEVSSGVFASTYIQANRGVHVDGHVGRWTWFGPKSNYCDPGPGPCRNVLDNLGKELLLSASFAAFQARNPADFYVVIVNDLAGGFSVGANTVLVGQRALTDHGIHTILHELGHDFGFDHNVAMVCPNAALPLGTVNPVDGDCSIATYAGSTDPMSGAGNLAHFPAYSKWALGWLTGKMREMTLDVGDSETFYLYDSTRAYYGNYMQLVLLNIDEFDSHLTIEFRTPVGFNQYGRFDSNDNEYKEVPSGIHVALRPGKGVGSKSLLTPYTSISYFAPSIATVGNAFHDPSRGIYVEMLSDNAYKARVRVRRV